MTPTQLKVYGFIFLGVILIVIMIIQRKNILSFLYPNNYIKVEMLELDNNVSTWIQEKNTDLRFQFNKGYYNIYHQTINPDNTKSVVSSIYREGRLAKFYYHEGFSDPIDFRQGKITGNPQIARELQETDISSWFDEEENIMQQFFKQYGWLIVGIIIVLVLYLLFRQQPTTPSVK